MQGTTIVTYKQERARLLRAPWWQRYWFDILLLIPAGYGLWQLQHQSNLALSGTANVPNPLQDPLLLIAPAIGIFAVALFTLRLVPGLMEFAKLGNTEDKKCRDANGSPILGKNPGFLQCPACFALAHPWTFIFHGFPCENFGCPVK